VYFTSKKKNSTYELDTTRATPTQQDTTAHFDEEKHALVGFQPMQKTSLRLASDV
jgi:hypothetical protein